jgi:hypothetical protein
LRDLEGDRHAAARERKDDDVPTPSVLLAQLTGELPARVTPIAEEAGMSHRSQADTPAAP